MCSLKVHYFAPVALCATFPLHIFLPSRAKLVILIFFLSFFIKFNRLSLLFSAFSAGGAYAYMAFTNRNLTAYLRLTFPLKRIIFAAN